MKMVNLEDLKKLKKVKVFDIEEFDGVRSAIRSVELSEIQSKDFGDGLVETRQIIIKSENLTEDGNNPINAIEYITLKKDKETGEFGIPDSKNSKAVKVLGYFKVESFDELVGRKITIVKKIKDNGKEFLGISCGA